MKPNVIVFGAGDSGQVYKKKQNQFNIIAFTDNDKKKYGMEIDGIKVISPENISNYSFDYVVIASGHVKPIKKQLQMELNLNLDKIIVPSKDELKLISNPFEDQATYNFATRAFTEIINIFNREKCEYYAEYGTLLGLAREGALIKWDDDIDFSVLRGNYENIKNIVENNIEYLNEVFQCDWKLKETYSVNKEVSAFILSPTNSREKILPFDISMMIVDIVKNTAFQLLSSVPKKHFEGYEVIEFEDLKVRVPNNYKDYLALQYGDWKTPVRGTSFDIYHEELS